VKNRIIPQDDLLAIIISAAIIILGAFLYASKTITDVVFVVLCLTVLAYPISRVIIMWMLAKDLKPISVYTIWADIKGSEEMLGFAFPAAYIPKHKQIYPTLQLALIFLDAEDLAKWAINTPETNITSITIMYDFVSRTVTGTRPDLKTMTDAERWMEGRIPMFNIQRRKEVLVPKSATFTNYESIPVEQEQ